MSGLPFPIKLADSELIKAFGGCIGKLGYRRVHDGTPSENYEKQLKNIIREIIEAAKAKKDKFFLVQYAADKKGRGEGDVVFELWRLGLLASLHVLKWHDRRENPAQSVKHQVTPPLTHELVAYYTKLRSYEPLLYASDQWYRDHFAHVLKVWMLGIVVVTRHTQLPNSLRIPLTGNDQIDQTLFSLPERLAVFTVAALTHDMGYPLQKMVLINSAVGDMLAAFGGVDLQKFEFAFSPPHHQMAQDMLKLIASRPHYQTFDAVPLQTEKVEREVAGWLKAYSAANRPKKYQKINERYLRRWRIVLRCQWKYFQKYARALEQDQHGFLSALLLQRKLLFFREGEFALDEDYSFALEEARQFLVRREILRAVASHTCSDIYFLSPVSAEALLFFCDEIQEWGRPRFDNLYSGEIARELPEVVLEDYSAENVAWRVRLEIRTEGDFCGYALQIAHTLYARLRSAPDTKSRKFGVTWRCERMSGTRTVHSAEFRFDLTAEDCTFVVQDCTTRKTVDAKRMLDDLLTGKRTKDACRKDLLAQLKIKQ